MDSDQRSLSWRKDPFQEGTAKLYCLDDGFLYFAPSAVTDTTKRHAAVLLVSIYDQEFGLKVGNSWHRSKAFLVRPSVGRVLDADGCPFVSLNLDPSHGAFPGFARLSLNSGVAPIERSIFKEFDDRFVAGWEGQLGGQDLQSIFDDLVGISTKHLPKADGRDVRVERIIQRMRGRNPEEFSFNEELQRLGISACRLSHLFSEQAGVSLRSFVLWRKIMWAIGLLGSGRSLTEIAHESGFSDSAHFSRTFQKTLGIPPSFMADGRFIQVFQTQPS